MTAHRKKPVKTAHRCSWNKKIQKNRYGISTGSNQTAKERKQAENNWKTETQLLKETNNKN